MNDSNHKAEIALIIKKIRSDEFNIRDHVIRRFDERLLSRKNIINVITTLLEVHYQEIQSTYRFIGYLDQDRPGGFTAVINEGVWIVTVFRRKLSLAEKKKSLMSYDGGGNYEN